MKKETVEERKERMEAVVFLNTFVMNLHELKKINEIIEKEKKKND